MKRLLKLVTFDITKTLIDHKLEIPLFYSRSAKKFGITVSADDIVPVLKDEFISLSSTHPNFGEVTGIGWEAWWTQLVTNSFKAAQPTSDEKARRALAKYLIEEYSTDRTWALKEGACDILEFLKSKNVLLGVISNNDGRLETILKALKIYSYFDFILTSYSVGYMKPNRKIFDLARQVKLQDLHPDFCMHVGDGLKNDYYGAKNAGWQAVYVGSIDANGLSEINPSDAFNDLLQLQQHLEKEFQFCSIA